MSQFLPEGSDFSAAPLGKIQSQVDTTERDEELTKRLFDFNAVFRLAPQFFAGLISYIEQSNLQIPISQVLGASLVGVKVGMMVALGYSPGGTSGEILVENNWLLCNGAAVSRTTYKALFDKVGTTHGVGDGSTTFNLPDMRGRVAVGQDASTFSSFGGAVGAETHTHALTEAVAGGAGEVVTGDGNTASSIQPSRVLAYIIYTGIS